MHIRLSFIRGVFKFFVAVSESKLELLNVLVEALEDLGRRLEGLFSVIGVRREDCIVLVVDDLLECADAKTKTKQL